MLMFRQHNGKFTTWKLPT